MIFIIFINKLLIFIIKHTMQERPVYLDLTKIRLPMSAFSSITHRLSGMYIFFVTLPLILYVIDQSLSSRSSFDKLAGDIVSISFFSFFLFISVSIFWYHILTGVRHLIMDFFHIGESLNGSHYSSIFTLFIWLLTSIVFCGYLFI